MNDLSGNRKQKQFYIEPYLLKHSEDYILYNIYIIYNIYYNYIF